MTEGIAGIIEQLEQQKAAIEKALAALRDVSGSALPPAPATSTPMAGEPPVNRRSEAQKKRWAERKAQGKPAAKFVPRKGGMTEDGRRRLAEAMKRRWAVKRAAVKKRTGRPKKAA